MFSCSQISYIVSNGRETSGYCFLLIDLWEGACLFHGLDAIEIWHYIDRFRALQFFCPF
jgi:hypothetical protein